jgi:hypothetical protein
VRGEEEDLRRASHLECEGDLSASPLEEGLVRLDDLYGGRALGCEA